MKKHHVSRLTVIGSGFVGEATGRGFMSRGYDVTFVDIKPERVAALQSAGLEACTPEELAGRGDTSSVTLFTVNTPTVKGKINLSPLYSAAIQFGQRLAQMDSYHVVVVRSTVVPGTSEELIKLIEAHSGKKVGRDFGVCMNPEYLREKTAVEDFAKPWIVVIGEYDQRSGDVVAQLYTNFDCPKHRVSLREAEMQKYVHNLYNAVKITFFNEMRQIARHVGIDPEHIFSLTAASAEGMWRPEYGTRDFGPFDGSCLPKDTSAYLAWASSRGLPMPLLAATIEVNQALLDRQASQSVVMAQALAVSETLAAPVAVAAPVA